MPDALHEYFQDEKNCYRDLGAARKAFGSTATTEEQYDQMEKTLGLMFLHCPEDMQDIVYATMNEATTRRIYFMMRWANEKLDNAQAVG
jgi:hypothetical protein